jgi:aldehyde dehydrogenase (NAD+)
LLTKEKRMLTHAEAARDCGIKEDDVDLLLIDGRRVPALSGKTFDTRDPTTGSVLTSVARGDARDIDVAVAAARAAFEGPWRKFTPFERQAALLRLADLVEQHFEVLARIDTLDMGDLIGGLDRKRTRAVALIRYFAGLTTSISGETITNSQPGDVFSYTLREPVGVVGAINTWNGPLGSSIWKLSAALAAGCTVVLKPAEQAPLSPLRLGDLCLEAGIPPGVVNVVPGFGDAGQALAAHHGVDKIAFTGSTTVGQAIIRESAGNVKRVSLELGGKSANIVFADADLDIAVPGAAMAVFAKSGQICSAGTRLYVEAPVFDEFVDRLATFARTLRVGDPLDPEMRLGPLVSAAQLDRVTRYLEAGTSEGACLVAGGSRVTDGALKDGYFIEPTVLTDVADTMSVAREEIFGPVICAQPFSEIDEVLARSNDSPYGLGGGVWTRDVSTAHTIARGLRTGSVWVNCYQIMDPAVPFGGYKMSGFGRESGKEHLDEFLETKAVWIKT